MSKRHHLEERQRLSSGSIVTTTSAIELSPTRDILADDADVVLRLVFLDAEIPHDVRVSHLFQNFHFVHDRSIFLREEVCVEVVSLESLLYLLSVVLRLDELHCNDLTCFLVVAQHDCAKRSDSEYLIVCLRRNPLLLLHADRQEG